MWYKESLVYQFIELDNRSVAKLFETYLINRDKPIGNISENNGHDVSVVKFDIEEDWKDYDENIMKKSTVKKSIKKLNKRDIDRDKSDMLFKEILLKTRDEIVNIFYDEYRFLSIFTKSNELYELRYLPTYAVHSSGRNSNNICYLSVSFNKLDNIDDEYSKNILIDIIKELNIKELNLDVEFGEKKLVEKIEKTDEYYNALLNIDYKITLDQ